MRRQVRLMFALLAAGTMTVTLCGAATATPEDAAGAADVVTREATAQRHSVASYWTEERKRSATPEPAVEAAGERGTAVPDRLPPISAPGSAPEGASTSAAPVPAGSIAEEWTTHGSMPATTIGKLFYVRDDGSDGYCSASVITAENQSTIWTAGHCVHGGEGRDWFDQFLFEPDHHDFQAPLGEWEWQTVATTRGWIDDGDWSYDIAAIALFPNGSGEIAPVTGSQGYKFGQGHDWNIHFFGYPEDGVPDRPLFNAERLLYCTGPTSEKGIFDDRLVTNCDMHHGASGGPWIEDLQTSRGWGYIVGAYSSRDSCLCDAEVRSAYHGDAAINVYDAVATV